MARVRKASVGKEGMTNHQCQGGEDLPLTGKLSFSFVSSVVSSLIPAFPSALPATVELKEVCSQRLLSDTGSCLRYTKVQKAVTE